LRETNYGLYSSAKRGCASDPQAWLFGTTWLRESRHVLCGWSDEHRHSLNWRGRPLHQHASTSAPGDTIKHIIRVKHHFSRATKTLYSIHCAGETFDLTTHDSNTIRSGKITLKILPLCIASEMAQWAFPSADSSQTPFPISQQMAPASGPKCLPSAETCSTCIKSIPLSRKLWTRTPSTLSASATERDRVNGYTALF
jgi:hypothetical protein